MVKYRSLIILAIALFITFILVGFATAFFYIDAAGFQVQAPWGSRQHKGYLVSVQFNYPLAFITSCLVLVVWSLIYFKKN